MISLKELDRREKLIFGVNHENALMIDKASLKRA
jgi:hypothetical protein